MQAGTWNYATAKENGMYDDKIILTMMCNQYTTALNI